MEDENKNVYECRLRGILKKTSEKSNCVVGDIVEISEDNYILNIKERKNIINRPLVANIDFLIIFFAAKEPNIDFYMLNLFISNAVYYKIKPIVVINKIDLLTEEEFNKFSEKLNFLKAMNIELVFSSIKENNGIEKLKELIKGKICAFGGPSGAGKSSTINLIQSEKTLEIGETSAKTKRGKHTTKLAELLHLNCGGYIIDTPGFSSLEIPPISSFEEFKELFYDFEEYEGNCKFKNCIHLKEPNCKVKENVEKNNISKLRYEFYQNLYEKFKNK